MNTVSTVLPATDVSVSFEDVRCGHGLASPVLHLFYLPLTFGPSRPPLFPNHRPDGPQPFGFFLDRNLGWRGHQPPGLGFFGVNTLAAPSLAISRTTEELVSGAPGQSVSTARFSILKSSALIRTLTCTFRLPTIGIFYPVSILRWDCCYY